MTESLNRACVTSICCAIAWYLLLISGYDLGQLVYGLRVLISDVAAPDDAARALAFAGTAALTVIPAQLGGVLGLIGSLALLLRQHWAFWLLLAASLCLCWPVLVWIVVFAVWRAFDDLGAALLLVQILITLIVIVLVPILAWRAGRRSLALPPKAPT